MRSFTHPLSKHQKIQKFRGDKILCEQFVAIGHKKKPIKMTKKMTKNFA